MSNIQHTHYHLITLFGDTDNNAVNTLISGFTPERETRLLCPQDEASLMQAAENSSLVIIVLKHGMDAKANLAKRLKHNRKIVSEVLAITTDDHQPDMFAYSLQGFDLCFSLENCRKSAFKGILKQRLEVGARRLNGFLLEEEYGRFRAALSAAPISLIVFDREKRVVFISEHYYRAYPLSAQRLIRGLSVHDAFDMMAREEQIEAGDERYEMLKIFWHTLRGEIECTLDNGVTYRLKADILPDQRGTIVTAQNITQYTRKINDLKRTLMGLKDV